MMAHTFSHPAGQPGGFPGSTPIEEFTPEAESLLHEVFKEELQRELQQLRGQVRLDFRLELQDLRSELAGGSGQGGGETSFMPRRLSESGGERPKSRGTPGASPAPKPALTKRPFFKRHARSFAVLEDVSDEELDAPIMRKVATDAARSSSSRKNDGGRRWSSSDTGLGAVSAARTRSSASDSKPEKDRDSPRRLESLQSLQSEKQVVAMPTLGSSAGQVNSGALKGSASVHSQASSWKGKEKGEMMQVIPSDGCVQVVPWPAEDVQAHVSTCALPTGCDIHNSTDSTSAGTLSLFRRAHVVSDCLTSMGVHSMQAAPNLRAACRTVVRHHYFDVATATCILVNSIVIGWQTDYSARNLGGVPPMFFAVMEAVFAMFFVIELCLRVTAYGIYRFFTMATWKWNHLDFCVVSLQVLETLILVSNLGDSSDLSSLSMLRVVRILRLVRSIRIVRLLRYLDDLRTVMISVLSAFKPLCSTLCLIALVIYMTGILFTEIATLTRLESDQAVDDFTDLMDSLGMTMMRLFQTITNGMEWHAFSAPLAYHVSPIMGIVFAAYIVFMTLAILNIVTGVFVDAALSRSRKEKDIFMINNLREFFNKMDMNRNGVISWIEFEAHLGEDRLIAFFKDIDLCISEAKGLFMLLDTDGSGQIDMDEFLSGCLNLRGPARALDMQLLMRELIHQRHDGEARAGTESQDTIGNDPVVSVPTLATLAEGAGSEGLSPSASTKATPKGCGRIELIRESLLA